MLFRSGTMPVTGFEIRARAPYEEGQPFGDVGAYERIDAVASIAVDPLHAANAGIVDLDRAEWYAVARAAGRPQP